MTHKARPDERDRGGLLVYGTHPVQYHAPVYRHLSRSLGLPVTVVYGSDRGVAGYEDAEFGVGVAWDTDLLSGYDSLFLRRIGDPRRSVASGLLDAARAIRARAPRAALAIGYAEPFHAAALADAQRRRLPLLFRGETTDHALPRGPLRRHARDALLGALYRSCAALLPIGARSRAHYLRLGVPPAKLFDAPYCVDTSAFLDEHAQREARARVRADLSIDEHAMVIGFAGKLSSRKGVELLPEAIAALSPAARRRVVALLVGDGERRAWLEAALSARGLAARFVGFQNQRALSPFYAAMDLFVLPSVRGETWGLVVNEALHHGTPCVVSDAVGSAPDLVEPGVTGEIATAGSATSLARAIERASALAGDEAVARVCRERVARYSVRAAAEGIARAFAAATRLSTAA